MSEYLINIFFSHDLQEIAQSSWYEWSSSGEVNVIHLQDFWLFPRKNTEFEDSLYELLFFWWFACYCFHFQNDIGILFFKVALKILSSINLLLFFRWIPNAYLSWNLDYLPVRILHCEGYKWDKNTQN